MEPNHPQLIKETAERLLAIMDFEGEVSLGNGDGDFLIINIASREAPCLIGQGGQNLEALQQIMRLLVGRRIIPPPRFMIDVNGYQKSRLELLKSLARGLAQEAVSQRESRWLAPMNAYERRLVHLTLADFVGVKTESEGEGAERRVVIKPI